MVAARRVSIDQSHTGSAARSENSTTPARRPPAKIYMEGNARDAASGGSFNDLAFEEGGNAR
jgi:hypothetical protein